MTEYFIFLALYIIILEKIKLQKIQFVFLFSILETISNSKQQTSLKSLGIKRQRALKKVCKKYEKAFC